MSEQQQSTFNGWAKVEVMGHQSHIGYVKTEAYGAAVLFRIDTPDLPEREYVLESPEYTENGSWTPKGAKVKRESVAGVSVLVGAGSIYRIVPCTEAAALKAIETSSRSPLKLVELPESKQIEAANDLDSTDGSDRCLDCGRMESDCDCEEEFV